MTTEQRGPFSFERPFFWSLQKLEILQKYATAAAPILARRQRVTFIDLMAGEGYYESGQSGSTGHFASIATANARAGRDVRCIAYEADPLAYERLKANTEDVREVVSVRRGNWESDVETLLEETAGDFVFFFVDPMGLRSIPWVALDPLVRRPYSELLVNFASPTAARLVGKWRNQAATASGDRARLDTVFGDSSWIEAVGDAVSADGGMHTRLAARYAERIQEAGGYTVAWLPVLQAGIRGRPKYHIMFASRNWSLPFEILNGILAGQTERLRLQALSEHITSSPVQGMLLPLDEDAEKADAEGVLTARLAASLLDDESLYGRRMTLEEVFREALRTRFGEYRRPLYRRALSKLDVEAGDRLIVHERLMNGSMLQWKAIIELRPPA